MYQSFELSSVWVIEVPRHPELKLNSPVMNQLWPFPEWGGWRHGVIMRMRIVTHTLRQAAYARTHAKRAAHIETKYLRVYQWLTCLTVISTVGRYTVTLELPLGVKSSARASVLARVALTWTLEKNNNISKAQVRYLWIDLLLSLLIP